MRDRSDDPSRNERTFFMIIFVLYFKEMFYLTTHSTHFIYGYAYMASDFYILKSVIIIIIIIIIIAMIIMTTMMITMMMIIMMIIQVFKTRF